MKRSTKRFWLILTAVSFAAIALLGLINLLKDTVVFFYTPADIAAGKAKQGLLVRVGGYVEPNSIRKATDSLKLSFTIRAEGQHMDIHYEGLPPPMFRVGQGIVAEGRLEECNQPLPCLKASHLLTKHDENYHPPEMPEADVVSDTQTHYGNTDE